MAQIILYGSRNQIHKYIFGRIEQKTHDVNKPIGSLVQMVKPMYSLSTCSKGDEHTISRLNQARIMYGYFYLGRIQFLT